MFHYIVTNVLNIVRVLFESQHSYLLSFPASSPKAKHNISIICMQASVTMEGQYLLIKVGRE